MHSNFGSKNGHVLIYKKNYEIQNGGQQRHIENRLLAISQRFFVWLTPNFVWRSRITFRHRSRDQNTNYWKFKMADGRHFENSFIAISQPVINYPISKKFGVHTQILVPRKVTCWFIKNYEIQNGGQRPYWKLYLGYISTMYCPINVKFDRKKRNYVQIQVTWSKYQNLKIQDGGRPPFWKGFITISWLRIIRFQWNLVCRYKIWFQEWSIIKVSKFLQIQNGRRPLCLWAIICQPTDLVGALS